MGTKWRRERRKKNGQGNWRLVRYCDDFVLMVAGDRHQAEALREEVSAVLASLGLRLAPEKTQVVHIEHEGFTFLGFDIRKMRKRGSSKYHVYTTPSKKAIASIKDKVKAKTYRSTRHMNLDQVIRSLNRLLGELEHPEFHAHLVLCDAASPGGSAVMRLPDPVPGPAFV